MSFFDTIRDMCGGDILPPEYRLTVLGSAAVYAEGVKSVKSFTRTEVVLRLKNSSLSIKGEELCIAKLSGGDAVVKGRINKIERI